MIIVLTTITIKTKQSYTKPHLLIINTNDSEQQGMGPTAGRSAVLEGAVVLSAFATRVQGLGFRG